VRTMDAALPRAGALAIAGDRIAGGVGTHETALASPEVVDLGGRCVVPGFTDSHVHFPQWSLAQHQVRLEGTRSLAEVVALGEEAAWKFRERYVYGQTSEDEWIDAMRGGLKLAAARGVTAIHDKDGWLGALRFFQRLHREQSLTLRVWQSLPAAERLDQLEE